MFYIGCHLSSAKGFLAMGKDAEKIGATGSNIAADAFGN